MCRGRATVVFARPVTLRALKGQQYTIDGGGTQILCIQGEDADTPLEGTTLLKNLIFINGDATEEYADVYDTGSGGALFVMGSLRAENCTFKGNTANYGAAICVHGSAVLEGCNCGG